MNALASILTGAKPGPRRMLVYGTAGIGKSTFATCAPSPVVIQTEDGLNEIDCHKFPVAQSLDTPEVDAAPRPVGRGRGSFAEDGPLA